MSRTYELDRVPNKRDWAPIIVTVAIALLSLVVSALAAYNTNDKTTAVRVTAVEVQQKNDGEHMNRIETKINQMDAKLDRLLER